MRTCFFLLIFSVKIFSQNFEGNLKYKFSTICQDKIVCEDRVDTLSYVYNKKGDYLYLNLSTEDFSVYSKKDDLIYSFEDNSPLINATRANIDLEERMGYKPKINFVEKDIVISGKVSSSVEIIWKTGSYKYYYIKNFLEMDPELFKRHIYDQWYAFLKISKSLPVRIEKKIFNFSTSIYELLNYEITEVDNSVFQLPPMEEIKNMSKIYPNKVFFTIKE